jgi:3'-phosphoadenosine 5'-phosphosulfate sulfotransferase (PAPS reductase)/FAD synthetase
MTTLTHDLTAKPFAQFDQEEFNTALNSMDNMVGTAIDRIREHHCDGMYVGHSGGKDSVLVRWMADQTGFSIPTVHTPKVEGPNAVHPLTMEFIYAEAAKRPILFVPLTANIADWGLNFQVDGTRRCEAERSDGRSTIVVIDGREIDRKNMPHYTENGLFGLRFLYPFVEWSNAEVWAAIYKYKIPYSKEYLV